MTELIWWVCAALAVGGGLGTILSRNPVSSLLFLILTFFNLAAIYVLLGAHFIAAIQVIVYAGAIMVLFLFVIMLLNLGHAYQPDLRRFGWVVAAFVTAGVGGYLVARAFTGAEEIALAPAGVAIDRAVAEQNAVGAIAFPLFREFLVPFEITSVLLLVAIVGAVLLAKRRV